MKYNELIFENLLISSLLNEVIKIKSLVEEF